jgi:hypothetical protein
LIRHFSSKKFFLCFLMCELEPPRRPDWWLLADQSRPRDFDARTEDEGNTTTGGTRLSVRFSWNTKQAEAYWDDPHQSPKLTVSAQGVELFAVEGLLPREWQALPSHTATELERVLKSTSVLSVVENRSEPGFLLVQEEGMSHRPSVLFELSPAEILRYWSLLTPAQRAAFLEARAPEIALMGEDTALVARYAALSYQSTFLIGSPGFS